MFLILCLLFYSEDGVDYDSEAKTVLVKVTKKSLPNFEVPSSVVEIKGESETNYAFYECRNDMGTIKFAKGSQLTTLGNYVFAFTKVNFVDMSECTLLETLPLCTFYASYIENIKLPQGLKTIGKASLCNTNLLTLDIPSSVTTIEDNHDKYGGAIGYNKKLTEVNIPSDSQLNYLGNLCFMGSSINSFTFPEFITLDSIKGAPFYNTPITQLFLNPNNNNFDIDDQHWTLLSENKIIIVVTGVADEYTIKSSVISISNQAFRGSAFTEIIFESSTSLTAIPPLCFSSCKFTSIEIPEDITDLKSQCFYGHSLLESIKLPSTLKIIEYEAFMYCNSLKIINFPDNLITIQNNSFTGCKNLTDILIPASIREFGTSVFSDCSENLNVTFANPDKFENIQGMLFENKVLKEYFGNVPDANLTIPDYCETIPKTLFMSTNLYSVTFSETSNCTSFEERAFSNSLLTSITLPPSLNSIGYQCFYNCPNLIEIDFSNTEFFTKISESCFASCTKLQRVIFQNSNVKTIEESAFKDDTQLSSCDLENSQINSIGKNSFYNVGIVNIKFPKSLKTCGESFFSKTQVLNIEFDNETTISILEVSSFADSPNLETVVICDSITKISDYCFSNCPKLINFTLGKDTNYIGQSAFQNCKNLKTVVIPEGSNLTKIMPFAFSGCNSFDTIDLKETQKFSFEDNMLMNENKTSLIFYLPASKEKTLLLSSSIEVIADYAFTSCTYLYEVLIPVGNLRQIGYQSFMNCTRLTRLYLPSNVQQIGKDAFKGCDQLKCSCVSIPEEVLSKVNLTDIGIAESLINGYCPDDSCYISFDKLSCKVFVHPFHLYSAGLFILIGSTH